MTGSFVFSSIPAPAFITFCHIFDLVSIYFYFIHSTYIYVFTFFFTLCVSNGFNQKFVKISNKHFHKRLIMMPVMPFIIFCNVF